MRRRRVSIVAGIVPALRPATIALSALAAMLAMSLAASPVSAQIADPEAEPAGDAIIQPPELADEAADRPVAEVRLNGLSRVDPQLVWNNVRTAVGDPFDPLTMRQDIQRLQRLGQFKYVDGLIELNADGTIDAIFQFQEETLIAERQVVGNKLISDQDLLAVVQLVPLGPRNDFLIENAKRQIEALYRKRGHYLTTVSVNETELDRSGLLIFEVIEGPRVKVRAVQFDGNQAFSHDQLKSQVKTRTALMLFRKGELDEEQLADDVAALDQFYKDRGYIDVRVDRTIQLSPDNREAKVVFVIREGRQYTVRSIRAATPGGNALRVFAPEQIAALMELKVGDVYSRDLLRKSIQAVQDAYGHLGYLDVAINATPLRVGDEPEVDVELTISEGRQYRVGTVQIQGNFLTRERVIRRELRGLSPGRPFDATQILHSEERLDRTRLFNDARITVLPEDEENAGYRDMLVEVKERNTGSVNFGVAVGSDAGVFGEISLNQNNFDITDWPETIEELISGRSFRGAGQKFNMVLRPGSEIFQFATSVTEPHLNDSDYSLTVGGQFRDRIFDVYDETRMGGSVRIGRAFGDVWEAGVTARVEQVSLDEIEPFAPTEIFLDEGPDLLTAVGIGVTRTTIGTITRPGAGSRLELSFDQYGALGGDFNFSAVNAEYTVYFTVDEDFLGRISTFKFTSRVGYIFGDRAPTYERFYLGGRSLRGFDFRTVSPRGVRADTGAPSDDPVGGTWLAFVGGQYEFPIFEEAMTGVLFIDSGTVTDDPGIDQWRAAIGAGIRLYIPQFGPVPIALDFAIPILKEPGDELQLFSFSAELPF